MKPRSARSRWRCSSRSASAGGRAGRDRTGRQPDRLLRRRDLAARAAAHGDRAGRGQRSTARFKTADGADPPPQLRQISIGDQPRRARSSTAACRPAGSARSSRRRSPRRGGSAAGRSSAAGHVQVRVTSAEPAAVHLQGHRCSSSTRSASGGHRRLLAQVYGSQAPLGLRPHLQDPQARRAPSAR